jgi:cation transport ATPase
VTSATDVDLLTRTTLQVDGIPAEASVAQMIRALQKVPGVLLAELNPTQAHAVVAHDAAVLAISLIAAAENAGVRVRIVRDTLPPTLSGKSAAQLRTLSNRQLLIVAALACVIVASVGMLVPNATLKHEILIVLTSSLWAVFLAQSFMRHRRS